MKTKMNIFKKLLTTPAEARPVYTQEELERSHGEMLAAISDRSEKLNAALLAKIKQTKAAGLSARDVQLTELEIKQALS